MLFLAAFYLHGSMPTKLYKPKVPLFASRMLTAETVSLTLIELAQAVRRRLPDKTILLAKLTAMQITTLERQCYSRKFMREIKDAGQVTHTFILSHAESLYQNVAAVIISTRNLLQNTRPFLKYLTLQLPIFIPR